jgi:cytochrome c-type biogenesis protein CcmE
VSDTAVSLGAPRRLDAGPKSPVRSAQVIIAAVVVIAAIGYLIYTGFQSTSVYYMTVTELKASGGSPAGHSSSDIRVAGIVQDNSVQRVPGDPTVKFTMADEGGSIPVVYKGLVPDIFGPNIQVVVEGKYTNGVFQAATLLAKCPSKFTSEVPTPVTAR